MIDHKPVVPDLLVEPLTRREREVLALLAQSLSDREIAARLTLSINSVKWYARNIYEKLEVGNRQNAVQRARELGVLADLPPRKKPPHNLPRQLTGFIGRKKEIQQVVDLVWKNSLVTLTGSGGVGKTRLALRVAEELLDHFPDGVWFVELAPVADPEIVDQEVASRLGLQKTNADSHLTILVNYLRGKKLLLILDNCEHLLDACSQLVSHLLQQCPQITLLATSRETLSISGEIAYRVPSLAATDPDRISSPSELAQVESVQLFAERAAAVQAGFSLSTQTLPYIARICHRLDGIPLAIELAAARVGMLSVEQIASRLADRFRLLTGGSRTALPRQRTLRASIDWSYSLLPAPERLLFQRLSVFSGGWTLPAAESVCAQDDLEQSEVMDALAGLVNKSLVAVDYQSGSETRYSMLETIRQYAQERLEDMGQGAAIRERHLAYFLVLAGDCEPLLRTPKIFELLDRLDLELDNLRGALEWALGRDDRRGAEQALGILSALFYFWLLRSLFSEVEGWINRAFKLIPDDDPQAVDLKTRSLLVLAILKSQFSQFLAEVLDHLNLCIAFCRKAGDRPGNRQRLALALAERKYTIYQYLFRISRVSSIRLEDAQQDGEESLAIAQDLLLAADPASSWFVSWIYFINALSEAMSHVSLELDPILNDKVHYLVQSAHEISMGPGDQVSELTILYVFATIYRYTNPTYAKQGIALAKRLGNKKALVDFISWLGLTSYKTNQFHDMEENFRQVVLIGRQVGDVWHEIYATRLQGIAAVHQMDVAKAQSFLGTAVDLSIIHKDAYGVLAELNAFAGLALLARQSQLAARLLGFVERQLEGFFKPMDEIDRIEFERHSAKAKEELGEAAFTALWAEGRAMTMEQAIQMAHTLAESKELCLSIEEGKIN